MVLKRTRYVGNNRFETVCLKCGTRMVWEQADGIVLEFDEAGDAGMLCKLCYNGPEESDDKLKGLRPQAGGNGRGDPTAA